MLRPRVIPYLLVQENGLVKTVGFSQPKYVGDPINAVKIFNEKGVDELAILDIDATAHNKDIDYRMIEKFAAETRMPLCYGGGVKTVEQAKRIIGLGVEKISISSQAIKNPHFVSEVAHAIGSQSVVVTMDVKKRGFRGYEVFTHNGKKKTGYDPVQLAKQMESQGAGEIVLNSIDNDGQMNGYDLDLVGSVRAAVNVPMTALGGAGDFADIFKLVEKFGVIGAGAGSMFVFKGVYRAVLINYLSVEMRDKLACACNKIN